MNRTILYSLPLALLVPASPVLAETPAFDRPGIAFSTTTIPPGSFSFEQGLHDFQRSSDGDLNAESPDVQGGFGIAVFIE